MLVKNGNVSNKEQFLADVNAREAVSNTGFEEGVAFPHAKSTAVATPGVAVGISRSGIDYGADDGEYSKLFFMIASPEGSTNLHVELLAKISNKLIEHGFINKIMAATTTDEALELLMEQKKAKEVQTSTSKGFIIGVTGCPTGVAHTYLAAEALEIGAANLGYTIKVETNGSVGVKNSPSQEEIAKADAIIVSCDTQVDMTRFAGKRLIKTGVKAPIKNAEKLIQEALEAPLFQAQASAKSQKQDKKNTENGSLYTYLMNGVSYMIPFEVILSVG